MKLRSETRGRAPRALAVRAMGALGLSGGVLAMITAILPPPAEGSEALILVIGSVSGAVGAFLLVVKPKLGEYWLGALGLLGTALITISTREGGVIGGTADNEILYLWVILYSFYFLSARNALFQTAVVGAAYGWLLSEQDIASADQATTQWLVTMATLLVAGLILGRLRFNLYRRVGELTERARTDGLTGLLNRSALEERVTTERSRSLRDRIPVSVLVIDIDGFKALNDSLGHARGDEVLKEVAAALVLSTRGNDAVARIGGDEFAVLLPGASEAAARTVAEGLRKEISSALRRENDGVTVSVGVATGRHPIPPFDELLKSADVAMYEGKRAGGNRVGAEAAAGSSLEGAKAG